MDGRLFERVQLHDRVVAGGRVGHVARILLVLLPWTSSVFAQNAPMSPDHPWNSPGD